MPHGNVILTTRDRSQKSTCHFYFQNNVGFRRLTCRIQIYSRIFTAACPVEKRRCPNFALQSARVNSTKRGPLIMPRRMNDKPVGNWRELKNTREGVSFSTLLFPGKRKKLTTANICLMEKKNSKHTSHSIKDHLGRPLAVSKEWGATR